MSDNGEVNLYITNNLVALALYTVLLYIDRDLESDIQI